MVADVTEGGLFEDVFLENVSLVAFLLLKGFGWGGGLIFQVGKLCSSGADLREQINLQLHVAVCP